MTPLSQIKTTRSASIPFLGLLAAIAALFMAVPGVSAAAPVVEASISHQPGTFHRGEEQEWELREADHFTVNLTNTGDAPTGQITVTEHVPAPFSAQGYRVSGTFGCSDGSGNFYALSHEVVCKMNLGPGESYPLYFGINVPANAPDTAAVEIDIAGGAISPIHLADSAPVADRPKFEVERFESHLVDENGDDYTTAGGHPYENITEFTPPLADTGSQIELMKDAVTTLPLGFFGNPAAAPRCPLAKIPSAESILVRVCPEGSRVGALAITTATKPGAYGLYNVPPDKGHPAAFAANTGFSTHVVLQVTSLPRSQGYGLTVSAQDAVRLAAGAGLSINEITAYFYGVPFVQNHIGTEAPFLSNPVDCAAPGSWRLQLDSWENAGRLFSNGMVNVPDESDPNWHEATFPNPPVTGCDSDELAERWLEASATAKPVQPNPGVQAGQPTGLSVDLDFPQENDPTDPGTTFDPSKPQTPEVKDITMKLPAGMAVSPSSATGLEGCSDLASDPAGDQVHYDTMGQVSCPDASRIGTAVVTSPLLALHDPVTDANVGAQPIEGGVYLLKPHPGDFASGQDGKFRLLINPLSTRYGLNFKLPGIATADKQTGQLTATFAGNPQLPSKHVHVELKSGPRAPLATPITCGTSTTEANLTPWGSPDIPSVNDASSFNVSSGPNGSPCVSTPAQRPFAPTLSAGTASSAAGKNSPFVLRIGRNDGEQELSTINVTTPKGFSAKLAGIPYCSEAALAAAAAKSGVAEQASASCPAASQIGTVTAGAGPGSNPYYANGKAYLSGPYKGAPLSFAFITPAVAGPFDLGNVLIRAAAYVDPETAQVTTKTDPLPQILGGVPLRIRSVTARLDRSDFTLNPTNCSAMSVSAAIGSSNGATANPSNPFQASGCSKLGFKPALKLSLKGGTARGDHPALKAVLSYPKGSYANIAGAVVGLPHSEFLAQDHIKTICTRTQFAAGAGNGAECPKGSVYGFATATTPLLDAPLSGPVFLRSSSHKLPDLVAALNGQIDVALVGRIDSKNGGIRTTFEAVPDAPVSKFVLSMQGGKKGLLENSASLCATVNKADALFSAQNGLTSSLHPVLSNSCKKKSKKAKGKGKRPATGR